MSDTLKKLQELIESRRNESSDNSYVASLLEKGTKKIAEKVGEEATEVVIASLVETKEDLINESADLIFHLSVLWADKGIAPDDVMTVLENRMGISGLDEKAKRTAEAKGKD
jgi:phosphoribosyl-ATP pyrophosphohydrolase